MADKKGFDEGLLVVNIELRDDDLKRFEDLKNYLGLKHNTEVLRTAIKTANKLLLG